MKRHLRHRSKWVPISCLKVVLSSLSMQNAFIANLSTITFLNLRGRPMDRVLIWVTIDRDQCWPLINSDQQWLHTSVASIEPSNGTNFASIFESAFLKMTMLLLSYNQGVMSLRAQGVSKSRFWDPKIDQFWVPLPYASAHWNSKVVSKPNITSNVT